MSIKDRDKYGEAKFNHDETLIKVKDLEIVPAHMLCEAIIRIALNKNISEQTGEVLLEIGKKMIAINDRKEWTKVVRTQLTPLRKDVFNTLVMLYGEKCVYCGSTINLQIDHIKPVSFGGDNNPNNLQLLCKDCNGKKTNKFNEEIWV